MNEYPGPEFCTRVRETDATDDEKAEKEDFLKGQTKKKANDEIWEIGVLKQNMDAVDIMTSYVNIDIVFMGFGSVFFKGISSGEIKSGFELYGLDKDLYPDTLKRIRIMERVQCDILNERNSKSDG